MKIKRKEEIENTDTSFIITADMISKKKAKNKKEKRKVVNVEAKKNLEDEEK